MTRNVYHFEIMEGTDFSQTFLYADPSTGLPINLTGYTADMKVKQGADGTYDGYWNPSVILELSSPTQIVLGGTAGTVIVNIAASLTTGLNWNNGVYNLTLISSTGQRIPFMNGFFTILSDADS
jgi:hypothetical protein